LTAALEELNDQKVRNDPVVRSLIVGLHGFVSKEGTKLSLWEAKTLIPTVPVTVKDEDVRKRSPSRREPKADKKRDDKKVEKAKKAEPKVRLCCAIDPSIKAAGGKIDDVPKATKGKLMDISKAVSSLRSKVKGHEKLKDVDLMKENSPETYQAWKEASAELEKIFPKLSEREEHTFENGEKHTRPKIRQWRPESYKDQKDDTFSLKELAKTRQEGGKKEKKAPKRPASPTQSESSVTSLDKQIKQVSLLADAKANKPASKK
jgi:hypothetical protein